MSFYKDGFGITHEGWYAVKIKKSNQSKMFKDTEVFHFYQIYEKTDNDTLGNSWIRLFAFPIVLMPLGKVWIRLFYLHLWENRRAD